jgi:hypothetical protein
MIQARSVVVPILLALATSQASAEILPPGATPTPLATGYNFTEGPVYDGAGGVYFTNLVFSNQFNSDIVRYNIATGVAQVVDPSSDGANGLFLDASGQVVSADGNGDKVVDADDYGVWRSHFGDLLGGSGGASTGPAVPEPSGIAVACLTAIGALVRRRRESCS